MIFMNPLTILEVSEPRCAGQNGKELGKESDVENNTLRVCVPQKEWLDFAPYNHARWRRAESGCGQWREAPSGAR
jgi:hypothetical protein